jgi:hypothetical protein
MLAAGMTDIEKVCERVKGYTCLTAAMNCVPEGNDNGWTCAERASAGKHVGVAQNQRC